jgi:hypothetical protein
LFLGAGKERGENKYDYYESFGSVEIFLAIG